MVYNNIMRHLGVKGYPMVENAGFSVSDLVYMVMVPILWSFRREAG